MRTVLGFLCLLLPGLALGQGRLSGVVQDSVTHQPLAFASVFLVNTTLSAITDQQGRYVLLAVPVGRYEIAAKYLGYRLRRQSVMVHNAVQRVDLNLPPAPQELGEVVVRAHPTQSADYQRFLEFFFGHL